MGTLRLVGELTTALAPEWNSRWLGRPSSPFAGRHRQGLEKVHGSSSHKQCCARYRRTRRDHTHRSVPDCVTSVCLLPHLRSVVGQPLTQLSLHVLPPHYEAIRGEMRTWKSDVPAGKLCRTGSVNQSSGFESNSPADRRVIMFVAAQTDGKAPVKLACQASQRPTCEEIRWQICKATPVDNRHTAYLRNNLLQSRESHQMKFAFASRIPSELCSSTTIRSVREEERKRISRELHDEISQLQAAAQMDLQMLKVGLCDCSPDIAELLDSLQSINDRSIESTRRMIADLRPKLLEDMGLFGGIEKLTSEIGRRHKMDVGFIVDGNVSRLPDELVTPVYRLVQESLNNVSKHARATQAIVELTSRDSVLTVRIRDNGVGIEEGIQPERSGFGLSGMQERVRILGGEFSVSAQSGQGTEVMATLPISLG